jgi:ATP-binding cassette, subfamily B, bacterial
MAVDWGEDDKPCISRGLIRRVFSYFLPYWRRGLLAIGAIGAGAVLGLAPAYLAKRLIDELTGANASFSTVVALVVAALLASVLSGLAGTAEAYLSTAISQGIMFDLRRQVFDRLLGQSVGFFTHRRTGDVLSRMENDVNGVDTVVSQTIFGLVQSVVVVSTTLAYMFWLDWRLTLLALVALPLAVIPSRYIGRRSYRARQRTQAKMAEMTSYLQEVLGISGMLLVKAFGKQRAERARFGGLNDDLRRLEIRQTMIERWFGMLMGVLIATGPALMWLYGGYLVIHDEASLGTVVTLGTVLIFRLYRSVADLGSMNVNVLGSLALFKRIFDLIDHPADVADPPAPRPLRAVRGAVRFEGVTFAYPGGGRPALADISFTASPGQLVALVGPTGAGKTTVSYLVPRFYDPQAGRVCVDGQDARAVSLESLAAPIGIVFQDTFLFHASIRENLRYARPGATDEELVAAARAAHLEEFVRTLPEGYDTVVGERGHRLSGGEKQRVALARVILKDPRILILDEATSNMDSVSERLIQAALTPLFAGRTSIVIAHRLSTILAADVILVLDRGRLVEQGTHAELLERGGLYATLYERQFLAESEPAGEPQLVG